MNNDPISGMTEQEIKDACAGILGTSHFTGSAYDVGLIIEKLQEWGIKLSWHPCAGWILGGSCYYSKCLQSSFLRQAIILGHWSPPKKVEEPVYWRHKVNGVVILMLPELIERIFIHPEEWEQVTVFPVTYSYGFALADRIAKANNL